jgi:CO/xanthine dehydrogenase Mo-binding subunit
MAESPFQMVGRRMPRIDGEDLVSARTRYVDDLFFPRMLHAKALLSRHHHAWVRRLDVTRAEGLPGVAAVITARDFPNNLYGRYIKDQECCASDKVRYLGDILAVVAAEDADTAAEALERIEVEYEELPALFDPLEAMKPGAVPIHPHGNLVPCGKNNRWQVRKGEIERGLKEADLVLQETYTSQMTEHVSIEPHVAIAMIDPQGMLLIYSALQGPFGRATDIAYILNRPLSKVRIIVPAVGGGFGGKNDTTIEPHVALLALKTGRPVKWRWTRQEEFLCSSVRHPFTMRHEIGLQKDGTITAKRVTAIADIGAYCISSPMVIDKHVALSTGPYRVPHVWVDGYLVYTNKQMGGALRGFGMAQATFAVEAQLDAAAKELGIDPLEIRLKNALVEGDSLAVGQKPKAIAIKPCLEEVARAARYAPGKSRPHPGNLARGRGIGALIYTTSILNYPNPSAAGVVVNMDGSVIVETGSTDLGQGSKTVLAQMAAEILGVSWDKISVTVADTLTTPYDNITASSRVTFVTGNAVVRAAQDARGQLADIAAELLEAHRGDLRFAQDKVFVQGASQKFKTLADLARYLFQKKGEIVMGKGLFAPPQVRMDEETGAGEPTPCYTYGAAIAEVEVDRETGLLRIVDLVACYDCGRAINPLLTEGQIDGGLVHGIGFTLMEDMYPRYPSPDPSAFDLGSYLVPTAKDLPGRVRSIIYESEDPIGPFGAKGVGEVSMNVVAAAVANAVYDAVGVRIKDLPITPERLLKAMRAQSH